MVFGQNGQKMTQTSIDKEEDIRKVNKEGEKVFTLGQSAKLDPNILP